jgi:hypothetical protein
MRVWRVLDSIGTILTNRGVISDTMMEATGAREGQKPSGCGNARLQREMRNE